MTELLITLPTWFLYTMIILITIRLVFEFIGLYLKHESIKLDEEILKLKIKNGG